MAGCECRATACRVVKCDEHLMEEMRGYGFDPVRCGYRHNGCQNLRIVVCRCPDCGQEREVVPGNARRGLGIRCPKCAGAKRVGQPSREPVRTCECGAIFSTHSKTCDDCMIEELCELGHDALKIERKDQVAYAVCRCSICKAQMRARVDDLKRPRTHRPWRCRKCSYTSNLMHLTTSE